MFNGSKVRPALRPEYETIQYISAEGQTALVSKISVKLLRGRNEKYVGLFCVRKNTIVAVRNYAFEFP